MITMQMPSVCCIPNCKVKSSNSHMFVFPKEDVIRKQWITNIPRNNLEPSATTRICSAHFEEKFIITSFAEIPSGDNNVDNGNDNADQKQRQRWRLRKDAIPTIFPGLPPELTPIQLPPVGPADIINSLESITFNEDKFDMQNFIMRPENDKIHFLNICTNNGPPRISSSFTIDATLNVVLYQHGVEIEKNFRFKRILGDSFKCNTYPKLNSLINELNSRKKNVEDRLAIIKDELASLMENNDLGDEKLKLLKFWHEQFQFMFSRPPTFSIETIVFAYIFYGINPSGYSFLRKFKCLVLPHENFLSSFKIENLTSRNATDTFLPSRKPIERIVNLIISDVAINPFILKENNESTEIDEMIKVFVISSLYVNRKDMLGLYPIKGMDAITFYRLIMETLKMLNRIEYEVVSIIIDSTDLNQDTIKQFFSNKTISSYILSPFEMGKKIFFLYDNMDILKTIRCNWTLNHKFKFPSFSSNELMLDADLDDLVKIHEQESFILEKYAPNLSDQVFHPPGFGVLYKDVSLSMKLFHSKSLEALTHYNPRAVGTHEFVELIQKWWSIANSRAPSNNDDSKQENGLPITNPKGESIKFLLEMVAWLKRIKKPAAADDTPAELTITSCILPDQVHATLIHNTTTMAELCKYLMKYYKPNPIELMKFQISTLDFKFEKYQYIRDWVAVDRNLK